MDGCLVKPIAPKDLVAAVEMMSRANPAPAGGGAKMDDQPHLSGAAAAVMDETIVANVRQLGDRSFFDDLTNDFMTDAKSLIDLLITEAAEGDLEAFRFNAHALRSSAANIGAIALAELCAPWIRWSSSELRSRAPEFASHARSELARTQEAILVLSAPRQLNNA
jgi:two-component system sensor histidine kinase RpfC